MFKELETAPQLIQRPRQSEPPNLSPAGSRLMRVSRPVGTEQAEGCVQARGCVQ